MILLTGGSGLLGRHLWPLLDCQAPSHAEFDVTHAPWHLHGVTMIVHAAAYTDVARAEQDREGCFGVNAIGTLNMALLGLPLVYISTEYVFDGKYGNYGEEDGTNPVNVYGRSKELGERLAKYAPRWLIIRTLFKPRPFKHPKALTDQLTTGDYVDVIAPMIAKAVMMFNWKRIGNTVLHIGTEKKTTFDLAKQTKEVEPITLQELCTPLPRDTSLNCSRWRHLSAA